MSSLGKKTNLESVEDDRRKTVASRVSWQHNEEEGFERFLRKSERPFQKVLEQEGLFSRRYSDNILADVSISSVSERLKRVESERLEREQRKLTKSSVGLAQKVLERDKLKRQIEHYNKISPFDIHMADEEVITGIFNLDKIVITSFHFESEPI